MHDIRITRGGPTAEELAAVVVVLTGLPGPVGSPPDDGVSADGGGGARWRRSARPALPGALRPAPGAWRASALPT